MFTVPVMNGWGTTGAHPSPLRYHKVVRKMCRLLLRNCLDAVDVVFLAGKGAFIPGDPTLVALV